MSRDHLFPSGPTVYSKSDKNKNTKYNAELKMIAFLQCRERFCLLGKVKNLVK